MKSNNFVSEIVNQPIFGIRGKQFQDFIQDLLKRTDLTSSNIDILTNETNIKYFEQAFTHKAIHAMDNYEFFEILGDVTCNKSIVWYLKDRFSFLNNSDGVKVIARLKINLVGKENFAKWARKLNFMPYISMDLETKIKKETDVLEDCLEAFIGATEFLIDKLYRGGGYFFCYRFLKSILDEESISLSYESLYDSVTRLKETFDYYTSMHMKGTCPYISGSLKFDQRKLEEGGHSVKLLQKVNGKDQILREMEGMYLNETKHLLCHEYLSFLDSKGYKKPISPYYSQIENCRLQLDRNG